MPTTYGDQFYLIDPSAPPPRGTPLSFVRLKLTDANDDGDVDAFDGDSIDGSDIISSWPGDTVRVRIPGSGNVTYTGITFYLADGRQVFTPTDGQILANGAFRNSTSVNTEGPLNVPGDLGPTCFTPGTRILTLTGPVAIEMLAVGDLVITRDHGPQPVRWIGCTRTDARGQFAPVLFSTGAIGNTEPLLVSPNHRMLITGWPSQLFCGEDEMLVAAKHLVNGGTIRTEPQGSIDYLHLLFDRHQIITSHGVWSESFYPGALNAAADRATARELARLFPDLRRRAADCPTLVRPTAKRFEAAILTS